ncbi:MAG: hypothetical protein WKG07_45200 [Hymenobacter sp.]
MVAVPSGNFGNLCAGLLAHASGLPVGHFIAACNANDAGATLLAHGRVHAQNGRPYLLQRDGCGPPQQLRAHPRTI